jgi:hypothetical protein
VKAFGYGRDPLCLLAIALYALNRWLIIPQIHHRFFTGHFNDLLLIPAALPLVLWTQRLLGWRDHDGAPTLGEVSLHLLVWTLLCEVAGPHLVAHATGDWLDAIAYLSGAIVSMAWWRTRRSSTALDPSSRLTADR